jgi:hypothetical protein
MKNTKTAAVCLIMVIILLAGLTGCQSNSQGLSQQETASETGTDNDSAILPVTLTAGYGFFNHSFLILHNVSLHRLPVFRRSFDDTHIPHPNQGHMQCSRNRGGG